MFMIGATILPSAKWLDLSVQPPLQQVRSEFRKILISMGFEEMPTNRWVESSFWNFDALFQPQSHPARDAHDTFFIKDPASTIVVSEVLLTRLALRSSDRSWSLYVNPFVW